MKQKQERVRSFTIDEIENIALYLGLGIIIVLDFVSPFIPLLSTYFSKNSAPFYLATLLVFRILLKKIAEVRAATALPSSLGLDFNTQIRELVKTHPRVHSLDFLATNTRKFYHAIEDLEFYAETIRILIYEKTPDLENIVERWKALRENGICKNLDIRAYTITPTVYGMIIDGKDGCFGFFNPAYMVNPQVSLGIMQVTGPYLLMQANPVERAILTDVQYWFNELFEHHAKKVYSSSDNAA